MTDLAIAIPVYISNVPDSDLDDDFAMYIGSTPDADVTLVTADNLKDVVPASYGLLTTWIFDTPAAAHVAYRTMEDCENEADLVLGQLPCGHGVLLSISRVGAAVDTNTLDRRTEVHGTRHSRLPVVPSFRVTGDSFSELTTDSVMEQVARKASKEIAAAKAQELGSIPLEVSQELALKLENRSGTQKTFVGRSVEDVLDSYELKASQFTEAELEQIDMAISSAVSKCELPHAYDTVDGEVLDQLRRLDSKLHTKLLGGDFEDDAEVENADAPAPM